VQVAQIDKTLRFLRSIYGTDKVFRIAVYSLKVAGASLMPSSLVLPPPVVVCAVPTSLRVCAMAPWLRIRCDCACDCACACVCSGDVHPSGV
jgi:hypothetical protein